MSESVELSERQWGVDSSEERPRVPRRERRQRRHVVEESEQQQPEEEVLTPTEEAIQVRSPLRPSSIQQPKSSEYTHSVQPPLTTRLGDWIQSGFTGLVNRLFPVSRDIQDRHSFGTNEIAGSTSLQALLMYNSYYSIVYAFLLLINGWWKAEYFDLGTSGFLRILIMVLAWSFFEYLRLHLGYRGNLCERVPQITAFFLLTLFPQFPLTLFFVFFEQAVLPLDYFMGWFMLIFIVFELGLSVGVTRRFMAKQTAQFFLDEPHASRRL